eukprot:5497596-Amphidinium_carterae.1
MFVERIGTPTMLFTSCRRSEAQPLCIWARKFCQNSARLLAGALHSTSKSANNLHTKPCNSAAIPTRARAMFCARISTPTIGRADT